MKYWEAILQEVLDKDKESAQFSYTNMDQMQEKKKKNVAKDKPTDVKKNNHCRYYLFEESTDIYFTQREAETMQLLLQGHTLVSAAEQLNLSPRTIEYYLKNMKMKLSCKTKSDLLKKVAQSDFIKDVEIISK